MSAAVDGNFVYIMASTQIIYMLTMPVHVPGLNFQIAALMRALAIVNNLVTLIDGSIHTKPTSSLVLPKKEMLLNGRKNSHPCQLNKMERVHSAQKQC